MDEIARFFFKSQSLYRGGEFGKAFIGTQKELEILLSPYRALLVLDEFKIPLSPYRGP